MVDVAVDESSQRTQEAALPLVLVLAEESVSRTFMKTYLSGEGYEVIAFSEVLEARSVLDECTPALVIAEIEGREMPGYDLCAHCKNTPRLKFVPVLLITSSAYPSDYARAHSAGAVVCMAKPYRRERLGHVVRLLAPPPDADANSMPPRKADTSRRAGRHRSKVPTSLMAR
jgi:CheY-like chemotaxis protein